MTLEEAQEQIVTLTERVTELETERDTLSKNNTDLTADLERVRTLNQKYFEKLSMQTLTKPENNDEDKEPVSCEEFAKTIKF